MSFKVDNTAGVAVFEISVGEISPLRFAQSNLPPEKCRRRGVINFAKIEGVVVYPSSKGS